MRPLRIALSALGAAAVTMAALTAPADAGGKAHPAWSASSTLSKDGQIAFGVIYNCYAPYFPASATQFFGQVTAKWTGSQVTPPQAWHNYTYNNPPWWVTRVWQQGTVRSGPKEQFLWNGNFRQYPDGYHFFYRVWAGCVSKCEDGNCCLAPGHEKDGAQWLIPPRLVAQSRQRKT